MESQPSCFKVMRPTLQNFIIIIILAAISFGVYANSLHGDFLIDDTTVILNNEQIHDTGVYFSKHFKIRPCMLSEVIRTFLWHIGGAEPFYYHLFNVLVNVICVILVFVLCNSLFNNKTLSFLSSLIFALHPIHTEAVSWISGGPYVLSSMFFIAAFIFYIRSNRSMFYLTLSVVAFSFCLLAGNSVAVLPIMFILYELLFREKASQNLKLFRFRLIVLFLVLAISVIFIGMFFVMRNKFAHLIFQFRGLSYLVVVAKAFLYYLKILYLPLQRGLYHPFSFNTAGIQNLSPALFSSVAVIIIAIVSFFKCKRNLKPVSFGIMWFFVTYLPYSNIIPVCNIISERYLFLPSVGFSIIMAALFLKVWAIINKDNKFKTTLRYLAIIAITLYLGCYAAVTVKQNYEYNNIITYWETNINNFDDGYIVYNNLAGTYYLMGNLDSAIAYCWINLMINPNQPHVWCNLGKVYREKGDVQQAEFCYNEALQIDENYFPAIKALGEMDE